MGQVRLIAPHLRSLSAPEPLRALPGWLLWRLETYSGEPKPRKVPYYVSGTRRYGQQGTPQDRAQLTAFAAARDAAVRLGFDGVGFALLPDWQVTALDVDHCVAADGSIPPEIYEVVRRTYAEYSPSGTGIRAFFMGNLGNHKSRAGSDQYGLETFASSGFVTFTANPLPHVDVLGYEDRVAPVDDALTELCQQRFGAVSSSFDPDDFMAGHEPRLGLTVQQIEDLLQALDPDMGRDQWLRVGLALHHETEGDDTGFALWDEWSSGGGTYPGSERLQYEWDSFKPRPGRRQVTMASVIKMAREATQPRPSIATAEELSAASSAVADLGGSDGETPPEFEGRFPIVRASATVLQAPAEWIVKNIMPKADIGIIFGASGSGKTFVALDLAMAIARGEPWHGHRVPQARSVLYIAAEGSGGIGKRIDAYCRRNGLSAADVALSVMYAAPNFMNKDDIADVLRAIVAAGGFDVIIVDTFAQVTPGANENAAEDMGTALANTRALCDATDAMVALVHHAGKDASKGSRGWSGLKAAADVQIEILRHDNGVREIHLEKLKDGEDGLRWAFALDVVELGFDNDGDPITSCVLTEAAMPKTEAAPGKGVKRRGRIENHILETMTLFGASDSVKLHVLVDRATETLPAPEPGKRDTRRQQVTRAIQTLSKEANGPLQVQNNLVIFYE
jgi:RecA/RadA recombinase